MNVRFHILPKIGVTGVTHVTTYAKRPNSLAFTPVTRMLGSPYSRCNSAQTCNAKPSPRPAAGSFLPRAERGASLVMLAKYRARDRGAHDSRASDQ